MPKDLFRYSYMSPNSPYENFSTFELERKKEKYILFYTALDSNLGPLDLKQTPYPLDHDAPSILL